MKKTLIFALLLVFGLSAFSQISEFTIKKPGKTKILYTDAYLQFEIDITGDSLEYGWIDYIGDIEDFSEESLVLSTSSINTYWSDDDYNSYDLTQYFSNPEDNLIQIDPKSISSIYYQSSTASAISTVSGFIATLGYTAALVVAPLISIDYKGGDFKMDRYFTVAGAGLIAFSVTLPIAILTSGRTFEFKDLFENNEFDERWQFDYDYIEEW